MRIKLLALFLCPFLLGLSVDSASADNRKKVFILHSYEMNHVCGKPQHDGVVHALKQSQGLRTTLSQKSFGFCGFGARSRRERRRSDRCWRPHTLGPPARHRAGFLGLRLAAGIRHVDARIRLRVEDVEPATLQHWLE